MERNSKNYQNGKIYKIVSNVSDKIYIGSTCQPLSKRLSRHRSLYKSYLKTKKGFTTSFSVLEEGNYEIILVENFPCSNQEELRKRERHFIESLQCVNKVIPSRSASEYYETNKYIIKERKHKYYQNNIDLMKKRAQLKYEANHEYYQKYRDEHKEIIREVNQKYREQNKEKLKEKQHIKYIENKEKYTTTTHCECGGKYTFTHQARHNKSKKHISFMVCGSATQPPGGENKK